MRLGILAAIPYLSMLTMLSLIQRSLIYQPRREQVTVPEGLFAEGQVHDVRVTADDGVTLHGWLALAESAGDSTGVTESLQSERPLILYFSGNAGHRGYRVNKIAMFHDLGCDVLIVDYRGYAENTGSPSERALARDARAVWNYATNQLHVPAHRIVLCGESLGGGVATRLAYDLCATGTEPAGLMLRATFSSLVDAAAWHYPWLPVRWVLLDRFPSINRISQVTCPLLVVHGHRDQIVPFEQGARLFDAAPAESSTGVPKRFLALPEADHNDIMSIAGEKVQATTREFLKSLQQAAVADPSGVEPSVIGE